MKTHLVRIQDDQDSNKEMVIYQKDWSWREGYLHSVGEMGPFYDMEDLKLAFFAIKPYQAEWNSTANPPDWWRFLVDKENTVNTRILKILDIDRNETDFLVRGLSYEELLLFFFFAKDAGQNYDPAELVRFIHQVERMTRELLVVKHSWSVGNEGSRVLYLDMPYGVSDSTLVILHEKLHRYCEPDDSEYRPCDGFSAESRRWNPNEIGRFRFWWD